MASKLLSSCRAYLEDRYRKSLGIGFSEDIASTSPSLPVWRVVSDDDLTTGVGIDDANTAALLLDPEIGVLLFLLPFAQTHARVRQQVTRGLALRSQLSLERNYTGTRTDASDDFGSWRIVMHWLVPTESQSHWTNQIMEVRRDTGFSEEISLDAIFLRNDEVADGLRRHGIPRLLLTTRQILRRSNLIDVAQWLNADAQVEASLKGFNSAFASPVERALAGQVLNAGKEFARDRTTLKLTPPPPPEPSELRAIHIKDFRNLRDFELNLGSDPVRVGIVHGPNGTGKSAISEALSIALFGSSARYQNFVNKGTEPDVKVTDRKSEYKRYLSPFGAQTEPSFSVNGQSFTTSKLVSIDETVSVDREMSATILTQDMSQKFAWMHGDELGSMVAAGFSALASHITDFCDNRIAQANGERQTFLARYGLSKAITKISTAYDRVARRTLDELLPAFPRELVEWVDRAKEIDLDLDDELGGSWRSWGEDNGRTELAKRIAKVSGNQRQIAKELRFWLEEYNQLAVRSQSCIHTVQGRVQQLSPEPAQIASWISTWGTWLDTQTVVQINTPPQTQAGVVKSAEMADRQRAHQKLVADGLKVRRRLDHLTQTEAFVRESWAKEHPDICPTCGANHALSGGIFKVIESLRENLAQEREHLAQDVARSKVELDILQKAVAPMGTSDCPVTPEQQSQIAQWVQWLIPDGATVGEYIKDAAHRAELISSLNLLRRTPSVPVSVDAEPLAEQTAERIASSFEDAERVFDAPATWKPVKFKLDQILSDVVGTHLPETLEMLWCELAYNLTSAPWLLAGRPCLSLETKKGQNRATLTVNNCLARYIFNQAEIHSFGVAWFLTRYLTHGRFFHTSVVMDDPAHDLDQTSFRELCRLLETLLRLHRVHDRQLSLIVMMNQESRAVELARATAGTLTVLSWAGEQDKSAKHVIVNGDGFFPPHPRQLFGKAAS